jgi:hypothetical protein
MTKLEISILIFVHSTFVKIFNISENDFNRNSQLSEQKCFLGVIIYMHAPKLAMIATYIDCTKSIKFCKTLYYFMRNFSSSQTVILKDLVSALAVDTATTIVLSSS